MVANLCALSNVNCDIIVNNYRIKPVNMVLTSTHGAIASQASYYYLLNIRASKKRLQICVFSNDNYNCIAYNQ